MSYIADLHIHSPFAQACSPQLTIDNLALWAGYKGIDLLGTGDCLHPEWLKQIKLKLHDRGDGIHHLKEADQLTKRTGFILTTEVACIYSQSGKLRRIHLLVLLPSIQAAEKLSENLILRKAKLASDGRPVLGMSVIDFCDITFNSCPKAIIIPAHIWTPWFGMYGDKGGFDFFAECFGKFSSQIHAVETGISSDPQMNWRVPDLDGKSIVSFSDPHSLARLGREATEFGGHLSYDELYDDLQNQNIISTIEFFPEEGKYHYSGHRKCNMVRSPEEVIKYGEECPLCHKTLTIGVAQRIEELATRSIESLELFEENGLIKSKTFSKRPGYRSLVQLEEVIALSLGVSVASKKVPQLYQQMVSTIGPEIDILTRIPLDMVGMAGGSAVVEVIQAIRQGQISIEPGFDGVYGMVSLTDEAEAAARQQLKLIQ